MSSLSRDQMIAHLDELLRSPTFSDYGPNGLQVEGRPEIRRVITAVSSCRALFEQAREREADAILVHHGLFWKGMSQRLVGMQYERVRELIEGGINLIAYHLPLDAHEVYGNNALGVRAFGIEEIEPFAEHNGQTIGFCGQFPEPISADELYRRCTKIYSREPLFFNEGPQQVRSLGIVSGGAQKEFYQAIDAGLDAFITGEVSEWVMNVAKEAGVHYLSAGHYATERLGIRALGEHLAEEFGLAVEFIDIDNPV